MAFASEPQQFVGLSDCQVQERLKQEGYNELPTGKQHNILKIALEIVQEPIFLRLLGCGAIYSGFQSYER
jgi:P-type Ca2+ transporter type 2C